MKSKKFSHRYIKKIRGGNKSQKSNRSSDYNCSKHSFFNCKNNCKWHWDDSNPIFGKCQTNIYYDDNEPFLSNIDTDFSNMNNDIKNLEDKITQIEKEKDNNIITLRNEILQIKQDKDNKLIELKNERKKMLKKLTELSEKSKMIGHRFNSMNNNNSRKDISITRMKIREEHSILQIRRDKLESILELYDSN